MRFALAALLMAGPLLGGPADDAPALTIPRVKRAPKLSDFLNNVPREAELVVTDFRQMDPGDGEPVTQPTTAFLSYDDKNLYVGWICKDNPKLIRSRVARRKDILYDDRVTINIDTFHDHRHAYWFDVNPHGVQFDGVTTDGYGDDTSWEGLWYTEARIVADGYVVLETIPFRTLRFSPSPGQRWGILLARCIQRNNEWSCWPFVSRKRFPAFVAQFGHLDGVNGISPGRNYQIIPYLATSNSRYLDTTAAPPVRQRNNELRGGLDARAVIKDNLTLDLTVNPDFSQVESDEPQVTVNQRYEVFYDEKRPFFQENASFFFTPQLLFFSRRIIDPSYGARLTGKIGRWSLGVLSADDRAPAEHATNNVLLVQRDFFKDSHFRVMATDREQSSAHNRVGSVDLRLRLPRSWFLTSQMMHSDTLADGSNIGGNVYFAGINRSDRHWTSKTTYTGRTPGFRAQLGYIPRVDIRELKQVLGYKWRPPKSKVVDWGPSITLLRNWTHAGRVQDWEVTPSFNVELIRLTEFEAGLTRAFELYNGLGFDRRSSYALFKTEWYKWLSVNGKYTRGTAINYYPAAGLRPSLADFSQSSFGMTLRPTERLRIDETYLYNHLSQALPFYSNHVWRSKLNYQFTREFSLRAIVDYNALLPNEDFVSSTRDKRLNYDFLFTWLLHPGTALYAGYTDIYENYRYDPSRPPYLQRDGAPTFSTGRQAFVKMSYAFRF